MTLQLPARTVLAGCALALAGCGSAPDTVRTDLEVQLPAAYAAGKEIEPAGGEKRVSLAREQGWLADFEGTGVPDVVGRALAGNFDLRAASARMAQARAQVGVARADALPQLSGSADGSRRRTVNEIGGPFGDQVFSDTNSRYQVSLRFDWEVDLWGRLRDQTSAAIGRYEAARADYQGARLSLAANVAQAYFSAVEAELQVELARETVESFAASENLIEDRFEQGLSPALDLRLARANTESARAALQERLRLRGEAIRALEVLLGEYPAGTVRAEEDLPGLDAPLPVGVPSGLVERRPDLVAAERRLAASGKEVWAARKALLPRFSLTGGAGSASNELEDILDTDFRVWDLAGQLVAPLFQGGRLRANVRREEAAAQEALANYGSTALVAFREVEDALAAEGFMRGREEALTANVAESARAEELARERYGQGLADIITVLESQRRAFNARSELLAVRNLRLRNRIDLYLALGGAIDPAGERGYAGGGLPGGATKNEPQEL